MPLPSYPLFMCSLLTYPGNVQVSTAAVCGKVEIISVEALFAGLFEKCLDLILGPEPFAGWVDNEDFVTSGRHAALPLDNLQVIFSKSLAAPLAEIAATRKYCNLPFCSSPRASVCPRRAALDWDRYLQVF